MAGHACILVAHRPPLLLLVGGLVAALAAAIALAPAAPLASLEAASIRQPASASVGDGLAGTYTEPGWVMVRIQTSQPTAAEALAEARRATQAVLARFDQRGIARARVQTAGISLVPVHGRSATPGLGTTPSVARYRAVSQFAVLVSDRTGVGQVVDGVRSGRRDGSLIRAQAWQEAGRAAPLTADAMAAPLTLRVRPVLRVREELVVSPVPGATAQPTGEGSDVPVAGGHLTARVRVDVAVALVPTP